MVFGNESFFPFRGDLKILFVIFSMSYNLDNFIGHAIWVEQCKIVGSSCCIHAMALDCIGKQWVPLWSCEGMSDIKWLLFYIYSVTYADLLITDLNECNQPEKCNRNTSSCINTKGSYTCQCNEGYSNKSKLVCIGKILHSQEVWFLCKEPLESGSWVKPTF